MPIVGKFFPSQKSQEKVFLLLRRHWFTYAGFVAVAFIMSVPLLVLIVFWINRPEYFSSQLGNVAIIGVFAYILFALALMLYGFIDYYLDVYIITNERIVNVEQNGFFRREISELHFHQIQDVSAKVNGFFPTLIHYGDIFIQTAGERENFIFKSIPNPYKVSKLIVDLHEAKLEEQMMTVAETSERMSQAAETANESEKTRDLFDLEQVNPKSLSLARSRTKEFLKTDSAGDENLKEEIEHKMEESNSEKLLNGVAEVKATNNNPAKAINTHNKHHSVQKKPTTVGNSSQGEMHEDEEIDISEKDG